MITFAGTVVGASWPVFLAAIPVGLGALIYLYRAKGTGQPQVTSTLFLLSQMPHYAPNRRRFVPPLQFWLELALAIALAFAASGIMSAETGARVAIVVDTSKSMGARLETDETRLDAAIRIAVADVAQAPSDTTFTVFSAGRTLTAMNQRNGMPATTRADGALGALNALQPTYEVDSLGSSVAAALARGEYDSVWLYTDRVVDGVSRGGRLRVTTIPFDPDTVQNRWISAVAVRGTESPRIEVSVSRVGGADEEVTVTATCTDRGPGNSFALPAVIQRVASRGTSRVQLSGVSTDWSYCRVSAQGTGTDLLPHDDVAWVVQSAHKGKIGVVSELSVHELGLDRVPYGTAVPLDSKDTQAGGGLWGVIYHRAAPKNTPDLPTMVVYPNTGMKLWGALVGDDIVKSSSGAVEITRWEESHPILQYVRPALITLPTARVLQCPSGAQPILYAASGPIVCAGEDNGKRYVILGFEIFPFDGVTTPTLSILTLNALQWLGGGTESSKADVVATGVIRLPGTESHAVPEVRIVAPHEEKLTVTLAPSVELTEPGVLSIVDTPAGKEKFLAVNALSDQESDLSLQTPVEIVASAASSEDASLREQQSGRETVPTLAGSRETTHYESVFAWCALFLVAIDLLRRIVGRNGWRESA
jgi:hypothetical protein